MNKYQAWHEEAQMMIEDEGYVGEVYNWLHQGQPLKIRRPTETKDNNQREIYEGDLYEIRGELFEIVYHPPYGAFMASGNLEEHGMSEVGEYGIYRGDIYQTPELLKLPTQEQAYGTDCRGGCE